MKSKNEENPQDIMFGRLLAIGMLFIVFMVLWHVGNFSWQTSFLFVILGGSPLIAILLKNSSD